MPHSIPVTAASRGKVEFCPHQARHGWESSFGRCDPSCNMTMMRTLPCRRPEGARAGSDDGAGREVELAAQRGGAGGPELLARHAAAAADRRLVCGGFIPLEIVRAQQGHIGRGRAPWLLHDGHELGGLSRSTSRQQHTSGTADQRSAAVASVLCLRHREWASRSVPFHG